MLLGNVSFKLINYSAFLISQTGFRWGEKYTLLCIYRSNTNSNIKCNMDNYFNQFGIDFRRLKSPRTNPPKD